LFLKTNAEIYEDTADFICNDDKKGGGHE